MAWLTVDELLEHTPLDVFDANGVRIDRKITGLDVETGEVESYVADKDGQLVEEPEGEFKRRREKYPSPLIWKTIPAEAYKGRRYWDQDGR